MFTGSSLPGGGSEVLCRESRVGNSLGKEGLFKLDGPLILRRELDVIDDKTLHRPLGRFQFEPQLLLNRG